MSGIYVCLQIIWDLFINSVIVLFHFFINLFIVFIRLPNIIVNDIDPISNDLERKYPSKAKLQVKSMYSMQSLGYGLKLRGIAL